MNTIILCRDISKIPAFEKLCRIKNRNNEDFVYLYSNYSVYSKVIKFNDFFCVSFIKCENALKMCKDKIVIITTQGCINYGKLKIHNFHLNYLIKKYKKRKRLFIHYILIQKSQNKLPWVLRQLIIQYLY
jgi:hypothetical protein